MESELDIRTAKKLTIKAEAKNFSISISGFAQLDTSYELTLTNIKDGSDEKNFNIGSEIIIDDVSDPKKIDVVFNAENYEEGTYLGVLESQSRNSDVFLYIEITVIIS